VPSDTRSFHEEFERAAAALFVLVPFAAVEHVGSTAVPGSATKGDLDILVRVDRADFENAQFVLDAALPVVHGTSRRTVMPSMTLQTPGSLQRSSCA